MLTFMRLSTSYPHKSKPSRAELRMPKSVTFAKQANVAIGPQQVNNVVAPTESTG